MHNNGSLQRASLNAAHPRRTRRRLARTATPISAALGLLLSATGFYPGGTIRHPALPAQTVTASSEEDE
jgi:hypothetical protein